MRDLRRPLSGFVIFIILSLSTTFIIWSTLAKPVGGDSIEFSAQFTDASGLHAGDDVRMAGVRIGRVSSVKLSGAQAEVKFRVRSNQSVYTNTGAAIRYQNLAGQRYLALYLDNTVNEAEIQNPHITIAVNRTQPSFDVTDLLNGFQPLFSTLNPEQVNKLSQSIVMSLQGDGISLTNLLVQTSALANSISDKDILIGELINNLTSVLGTINKQSENTTTLLTSLAALVTNLNTSSAELGLSLVSTSQVSEELTKILSETRPTLNSTFYDLKRVTSFINRDSSLLAAALPGITNGYSAYAKTTSQGSYWSLYACDLDISLYGLLFPPDVISRLVGTSHSEVCRP
ncbi:MAG: MCE family protein [Mycobacteriaceae bacterium]